MPNQIPEVDREEAAFAQSCNNLRQHIMERYGVLISFTTLEDGRLRLYLVGPGLDITLGYAEIPTPGSTRALTLHLGVPK